MADTVPPMDRQVAVSKLLYGNLVHPPGACTPLTSSEQASGIESLEHQYFPPSPSVPWRLREAKEPTGHHTARKL